MLSNLKVVCLWVWLLAAETSPTYSTFDTSREQNCLLNTSRQWCEECCLLLKLSIKLPRLSTCCVWSHSLYSVCLVSSSTTCSMTVYRCKTCTGAATVICPLTKSMLHTCGSVPAHHDNNQFLHVKNIRPIHSQQRIISKDLKLHVFVLKIAQPHCAAQQQVKKSRERSKLMLNHNHPQRSSDFETSRHCQVLDLVEQTSKIGPGFGDDVSNSCAHIRHCVPLSCICERSDFYNSATYQKS